MKKLVSFFLFSIITGLGLHAQTFVSTDLSNKNVILEEYTGKTCGYCPDGHRIANTIVANNPGRAYTINIHQGGYANGTPNYTTSFGTPLANQTGLTGYPSGTVNRHVFSGSSTALGRGNWAQAANIILAQSSYVNVAAQSSIDFTTRELVVNVEAYYTGNATSTINMLNVALLQNNVLGPQDGMLSNPSQIDDGQYRHMHMLRHLLTGQWGDTIRTVSQGSFIQKEYRYAIPQHLNNIPYILEDLEVVVFIAEGRQEIITGAKSSMSLVNGQPGIYRVKKYETNTCDDLGIHLEITNLWADDTINSIELVYTYNGTDYRKVGNTRSIAPFTHDTIVITGIPITSGVALPVTVKIDKINGTAFTGTESQISLSKTVANGHGYMAFLLVTDRYASETSFKVFNPDGSVLLEGGPWSDLNTNTTTERYFDINPPTPGCYRLEVYDEYGDGINTGYYGAGYFRVFDDQGNVIIHNNGKFGFKSVNFLYTDAPVSVNEDPEMRELRIFPNPATHIVNIETTQNVQLVEVFNLQGQKVAEDGNTKQVEVGRLADGIYVMRITTDRGVKVQKFIKQ